MQAFKSEMMQVLGERGFMHQCSDPHGPRRACRERAGHGLYRLRLHGAEPACRQPRADHDAPLAAEDRPQADRADGRRHHPRRRSERQGREPQDPVRRGDRGQQGGIQQVFAKFLSFGDSGNDALMVDNADWLPGAQLRRVPARGRPAHLGQPDDPARFGEAPARARAAPLLPRIQLHGPAGLRLRRARPPPWLPPAARRLRPMGQHRLRHRPRPAHGEHRALRLHLAADHHCRRAPRWARPPRAPYGSTPTWSRPTSTGSSGGTPRTATSVRFLKLFTVLPLDEIDRLAARREARSTRRRRCSPTEATALLHGRAAAERGRRGGAPDLRGRHPRRRAADDHPPRPSSLRGSPSSRCSSAPASPPRTARRAGRSRGGGHARQRSGGSPTRPR